MRQSRPLGRSAVAAAAVGLGLAMALSGCVSTADETSTSSGDGGGEACENGEILIGSAMARTGFMAPFDSPALDTAKIAIVVIVPPKPSWRAASRMFHTSG